MGEVGSEELKFILEQYDVQEEEVKAKYGKFDRESLEKFIAETFLPKVKEKKKFIGLRKTIAQNLYKSYSQAVHVTLNMEVSMEELLGLREKLKGERKEAPSITMMIGKCVASALKDFPTFNATFDGSEITIYEDVNLAFAVDSPLGLFTPVVRKVDKRDIFELNSEFEAVAERARKGMLKEKDIVGGTFTITNLGMLGVSTFNPIINPPQVAILGVNATFEKPVKGEGGGIAWKKFSFLSLTFDHRINDGAPAARFLGRIKHYIENPAEVKWSGEK
ncbi:MAG TPA: 2-oxo acid dehydrogenase subunit E2 [Fervidicoccus fontis]|uniref:2-oxo acid dehydrogenase subunit E2 n=1 Tax=Fervidicoccus fontis TaxID=683846 RepID=A0A7C2YYM7_9CREN|nr:2-oxo acid dehydrogenase subunit E2 [Fervidicoccus fontis]